MRQETAGVTEALLESAKKEFLKYGFHDANLRRISADSGVSTNSIYTRFGDKSGLFSAVVKPAADGLMEIYLGSISEASVCGSANTAIDMGGDGTEQVLKYIYDNLDAFRLIFCRALSAQWWSRTPLRTGLCTPGKLPCRCPEAPRRQAERLSALPSSQCPSP